MFSHIFFQMRDFPFIIWPPIFRVYFSTYMKQSIHWLPRGIRSSPDGANTFLSFRCLSKPPPTTISMQKIQETQHPNSTLMNPKTKKNKDTKWKKGIPFYPIRSWDLGLHRSEVENEVIEWALDSIRRYFYTMGREGMIQIKGVLSRVTVLR